LKTGEPVNPFKLHKLVFDLKTVFANNGHPFATVEQVTDTSINASQAQISFNTTANDLVHFGDLKIKDMVHYSGYLARREITFKEAELYSRKKIIESQKRLYSTNLFNSINLDIDRDQAAESESTGEVNIEPDFVFSAIERKPHFISVKTGASQDSVQDLTWDFSTAWGKRNIFVSRRIELSFKARFIIFTNPRVLFHRYQMKYTEPWFINIRMPLTLTALFEPGVRSVLQPYRIQTWSVSLSTRKEWSEQLYAIISGEYENVSIYGIDEAIEDQYRTEQGISVRRKISISLIRDTRLDKFMPKSGSYTTYYAQYVGGFLGGDDSFLEFEFSWARYQQAIGSMVYATRIKGGWVKEFGRSHSVPSFDRYQLGGANSIRGFREGSIGPRNPSELNVGANAYAILNQELRFPLYWKFWGSLFADMGNGWESFSDVKDETVLFAYGLGIQFISPADPIRLDYAHRLENKDYKEDDRFHLTILYAF
jgi:outer membrane protein insertion porin family